MNTDYKNILVVNVNWVGDVIFSSPIFKALKVSYPQARISCLAPTRVKEILECIPGVDEIIIYDEKGAHRGLLAKLRLIARLKQEKFDVAFLLHRSLTRALLVYLAGIAERVGYDTKGRGFLLTHRVGPLDLNVHRSDYYINVIESFGIKVDDRICELQIHDGARNRVEQLLKNASITPHDKLIVLNAGGNWDLKRWPKEYFARLIDRLSENQRFKIALAGASADTGLAESILKLAHARPIVLAGQTNLKELGALCQRADFFISADTGPLHLANSVGASTIGLFGPTRPEITGLRGKGKFVILQNDVGCNRAPCYNLGCPNNACMRSIDVEDVVRALEGIGN